MKKIALGVTVLGLLVLACPAEAKSTQLDLTISNFRFCAAESCTPLDIGYLRTDMGPVDGADNPQAAIEVKRGTVVVWTYRDSFCDMIACPGHNVIFEDGTVQGDRQGFTPSGKGPLMISVKVTQRAGTTIRYFCSVNNHYQEGMTGILQVVA